MKQLTALLLSLLLCGCARQAPPVPPETAPSPADVPAMALCYDAGHPMEAKYPGLVRAYPLTAENPYALGALEKKLLLLSGQERTTLTVFSGDDLRETACVTLDFFLPEDDPSLQCHENGLSFFDEAAQETVVLDSRLQEVRRIAAPAGLSGRPIFSHGDNTLYYCTGWAVVAWDLSSGIRRTVKELSYEHQELTAVHPQSRILECQIRDGDSRQKLLIRADLGSQMAVLEDTALLYTEDSRYFAAIPQSYLTLLLFGQTDGTPDLLLPRNDWEQTFYLPEDHAAVTALSSQGAASLDYYELSTGLLRSSLTLEPLQSIKAMANTKDHAIYILCSDPAAGDDILYRWDVLRQRPDPGNVTAYTSAYRSEEDPDTQALKGCREYAEAIGRKYGITVSVWEEAAAVQPWDYRFTPEHLAPVLHRELTLLDERLAQYPPELLQQTKAHFTGLTICLVRQITGTEDSDALSAATGIQFFRDNHAYVVITTGKHSRQALYHELYHVMETHILTESTALDVWESLNPAGFTYGSSREDGDAYLRGQTRAFVDRYSMTAVKEDRARILENAQLPEKQELFRSEYMQRKLSAMCSGIREAYGLEDAAEILPWEQYLINPLAPRT